MPSRFDEVYSTAIHIAKSEFEIDFRPSTLLEESQGNGYTRVTKPVGTPTQPMPETQTTGGRGLTDYIAAEQLGANGRKK